VWTAVPPVRSGALSALRIRGRPGKGVRENPWKCSADIFVVILSARPDVIRYGRVVEGCAMYCYSWFDYAHYDRSPFLRGVSCDLSALPVALSGCRRGNDRPWERRSACSGRSASIRRTC
jgi:hypothetical protein